MSGFPEQHPNPNSTLEAVLHLLDQARALLAAQVELESRADAPYADNQTVLKLLQDVFGDLTPPAADVATVVGRPGVPVDELSSDADERIRRRGFFSEVESHKHIFKPRQWRALRLYHELGLTPAEVGDEMGISANAVYGLLRRANARWEQHGEQSRQERLALMKKCLQK